MGTMIWIAAGLGITAALFMLNKVIRRRRLQVLVLQRKMQGPPLDEGALEGLFAQLAANSPGWQVVFIPGVHRTREWRIGVKKRMGRAVAGEASSGTLAAAKILQDDLLEPVPEVDTLVPATVVLAWRAPSLLEEWAPGRQSRDDLIGNVVALARKSQLEVVVGFNLGDGIASVEMPLHLPPVVKVWENTSVRLDKGGWAKDIIAGGAAMVSFTHDGALTMVVGVIEGSEDALPEIKGYVNDPSVYGHGAFTLVRHRPAELFQPDLPQAQPGGLLGNELPEPVRAAFLVLERPRLGWGPGPEKGPAVPLGKRKGSAVSLALHPTEGNALLLGVGVKPLALLQRVACGAYALGGGETTVLYISPHVRKPPPWLAPLSAVGDVSAVDITQLELGKLALPKGAFRFFRFGHGVKKPLVKVAEVVDTLFTAAQTPSRGDFPVFFCFEDFVVEEDEDATTSEAKWNLYRLMVKIATQGPSWGVTACICTRPEVFMERYNPFSNAQTAFADRILLPGQAPYVRELEKAELVDPEEVEWYDQPGSTDRVLWISTERGTSRVVMGLSSEIFSSQSYAPWQLPGWEAKYGPVKLVRADGGGSVEAPMRFQVHVPRTAVRPRAGGAPQRAAVSQSQPAQAAPSDSGPVSASSAPAAKDAAEDGLEPIPNAEELSLAELLAEVRERFGGVFPLLGELRQLGISRFRAPKVLQALLAEPEEEEAEEPEAAEPAAGEPTEAEPEPEEPQEPEHEAVSGMTSTQRKKLEEAGVLDLVPPIADRALADKEVAVWLLEEDRREGDEADGWPVFAKVLTELYRLIKSRGEDPRVMFEQLAGGETPFRELVEDHLE